MCACVVLVVPSEFSASVCASVRRENARTLAHTRTLRDTAGDCGAVRCAHRGVRCAHRGSAAVVLKSVELNGRMFLHARVVAPSSASPAATHGPAYIISSPTARCVLLQVLPNPNPKPNAGLRAPGWLVRVYYCV